MATLQTGHVGLNVTDLARSASFYQRVLGMSVIGEQTAGDRRFAFLGLDGTLMLTLWQQSSGAFDADVPGLHHLSFQVPDIDAVRRAEAVVRELGAKMFHQGVVPHGEGIASGGIFFSDPDGIRLEIYAPAGADIAPAPIADAPTCGFF
ncbi:VOC family protein [Rhodococcus sp. JVH1]|uniref:VOC family protein n=1 Tax=Rhodococcus sp. JVH1 TaxID=745408 RepID=UPI0002721331|nr:VOC family protein [Rhodococcus sp. JVH1]EJI95719.1 glyoxalase/Bleomycin resistance protein/Dioxygenase superfamily protein [Rhodococcus sp. JVH1]